MRLLRATASAGISGTTTLTLVLIFATMAIKDIAYNIATFLISRSHGLTAGIADGVGDICNVLSVGLTAILTVHDGFSAYTVEAFVALLAGSIIGGAVGTKLGQEASDRLDEEEQSDGKAHSTQVLP